MIKVNEVLGDASVEQAEHVYGQNLLMNHGGEKSILISLGGGGLIS